MPQALLDGRPIGGYETLAALVRGGALDAAPTSDEKVRLPRPAAAAITGR